MLQFGGSMVHVLLCSVRVKRSMSFYSWKREVGKDVRDAWGGHEAEGHLLQMREGHRTVGSRSLKLGKSVSLLC